METVSNILETANGVNATRTEKMYNTFSNYSQLTEYLRVLTQGDLLRYNGLTQISKTAEMDLRFPIPYKWLNLWLKDSQGVGKMLTRSVKSFSNNTVEDCCFR